MNRPLAVLAVLAVLAALALPASAAAQDSATLPDIEDEVMCPICGTLLELSDSPQAERERNLIRRLIDEGGSKDEIKDALVAEYGPDVLATPEGDGFDLAAWLIPGIGLAAALVGVGIAVARSRRPGGGGRGREDSLPPGDAARLDEDLARYDGY